MKRNKRSLGDQINERELCFSVSKMLYNQFCLNWSRVAFSTHIAYKNDKQWEIHQWLPITQHFIQNENVKRILYIIWRFPVIKYILL